MDFPEYVSTKTSIKVIPVMGSQCALTGQKITTLILEYPRSIHAQLLTHRVFSKNSSSTRAVPIKSAMAQIFDNPARPIWTQNQKGMQGPPITDEATKNYIERLVHEHMLDAFTLVNLLSHPNKSLNIHKQNAGRYLEPFQNIRVCLTSTEWDNWDWLRADAEAQGEIEELANLIQQARNELQYHVLEEGQWHLPFVTRKWKNIDSTLHYFDPESNQEISLEEALNISMSVCAQTSYRKADTSLEKAEDMKVKLFTGRKVHASPSEHQATPIGEVNHPANRPHFRWPLGITHIDRNEDYWSGNFKNWIQYRQLLPNHDKAKF